MSTGPKLNSDLRHGDVSRPFIGVAIGTQAYAACGENQTHDLGLIKN